MLKSNQSENMKKSIVISTAFLLLLVCSCNKSKMDQEPVPNVQTERQDSSMTKQVPGKKGKVTSDMAYEGVNNYCHSTYDWSIAKENPSIMYVAMGEETESEYQVIFRSYTGAFVYFYVGKADGTTRMVEYVPSLDVENETGTIDIFDYID
jgi:hypothetical protein